MLKSGRNMTRSSLVTRLLVMFIIVLGIIYIFNSMPGHDVKSFSPKTKLHAGTPLPPKPLSPKTKPVTLLLPKTLVPDDPCLKHKKLQKEMLQNKKMRIPRIIHQTYKSEQIPSAYKDSIQSCLKHNPGWKYMFWTDEDGLRLVKDKYPSYMKLFDKYRTYARHRLLRADALRYFILHHYGGLYIDMDFDCLKPLANILEGKSCVMTPEVHIQSYFLYKMFTLISNAIMATVPRHAYFDYVINNLEKFMVPNQGDVLYITGPVAMQRMLQQYRKLKCLPGNITCEMTVLDPMWLIPTADKMVIEILTNRRKALCDRTAEELKRLTGDDKKLCDWLRRNSFNNGVPQKSYTTHRWIHLEYTSDYKGKRIQIQKIASESCRDEVLRYNERSDKMLLNPS